MDVIGLMDVIGPCFTIIRENVIVLIIKMRDNEIWLHKDGRKWGNFIKFKNKDSNLVYRNSQ